MHMRLNVTIPALLQSNQFVNGNSISLLNVIQVILLLLVFPVQALLRNGTGLVHYAVHESEVVVIYLLCMLLPDSIIQRPLGTIARASVLPVVFTL